MKNLVITIGRQCGSGGSELGKRIAEDMGMDYYDDELVKLAAKNSNLSPEISEMADEKATNSLLYSLVTGGSLRGMFNGYYEMPLNDRVFLAQADTIKQLAHERSCVIVGRCANYVLREDKDINLLNLFVYADMEYRIDRIKNKYNLNEAQAKDRIIKTEKIVLSSFVNSEISRPPVRKTVINIQTNIIADAQMMHIVFFLFIMTYLSTI